VVEQAQTAAANQPTESKEHVSTAHLSKPQKAAIIVRVLLTKGVKLSITDLPEPIQAELARQMGSLQRIDGATVAAVIEEFAKEVTGGGLSTSGGLEDALDLLEGSMSAGAISRLRAQSGLSIVGDPWERIQSADVEQLLPILQSESIDICAVILSKLPVPTAAECLGGLPGERARRMTYAMSRTSSVSPDAVSLIGRAVSARLSVEPAAAFNQGPVERVAAILNFSRAKTRNAVLSGLDEADQDFAEEVRSEIFTFANIPTRIEARDIPKIIKSVEQDLLVRALAAAEIEFPAVAEFIFGGISQRMADNLRSEMEETNEQTEDEREEAMAGVVNAIRELEENDEIVLIMI